MAVHSASSHPHQDYSAADEALFSKISWRLLPLLIICYIVAFIDRINIAFAQLQMKQTLTFSDEAYALGAGIFFVGYFLFEVPSNLILEKIGVRKTLLRIMFLWGICAAGMAFVTNTTMFYILRFLLGVFEAGFFPGIILYLTYWYPSARRGKIIAIFMTATSIAYLIAGPMSGWIMKYMNGLNDLHGWQWLFIVQGLPASVLGIVCYLYLKDKPEQADWLTPGEKAALKSHIDNDAHTVETAAHGSFLAMLKDPKVLLLSLIYFFVLGAAYTMVFLTPTLIKSWGIADVFMIGLVASVGPLAGIIGSVLIGRSSDKHLERRKHFFFCMVLAAVGLLITVWSKGNLAMAILGLSIMTIGMSTGTPLFFAAVSEYLPKASAAAGIALISSLGNLGPSVMPYLTTWIKTSTGSFTNSMYLVIALWVVAAFMVMLAIRPAPAGHPQLAPARA